MVDFPILNYPIYGPIRELMLSLEIVMTTIILEISTYFFIKYWNNKKNKIPTVVEFDWGIIFLGFSLTYISYIIGDYFYFNRQISLIIAYFCLGISGLIFSYHIELTKMLNTKFLFSVFTAAVLITILLTFLFATAIMQIIASFSLLPAYILLLIYFLKISKKIWLKYKFQSIGLFLAIFLWLFGYAVTTDISIRIFNGFYIRVIGDIIIVIGMLSLGFFLNSIPSLSEIGWQREIKYIILLEHSGICLFHENFQEKKAINEIILAGALSAIKIFMETTLKAGPKIRVISEKEDVFLIEEGKYIVGVLIVKEELEILKYLLKKIINQFEGFFSEILKDWQGDSDLFKPAKKLIDDTLSIEKI